MRCLGQYLLAFEKAEAAVVVEVDEMPNVRNALPDSGSNLIWQIHPSAVDKVDCNRQLVSKHLSLQLLKPRWLDHRTPSKFMLTGYGHINFAGSDVKGRLNPDRTFSMD